MKWKRIFVVPVLVLLLLSSVGFIEKAYAEKKVYKNKQYGISIACPNNWLMDEINERVLSRTKLVKFHIFATGRPEIELDIQHENPRFPEADISSPLNYAKTGIAERQKNIKNFKLIEGPTEVIINGNKLIKVAYRSYIFRFEEYYFLKNGNLFILEINSSPEVFDKFRGEFDEAINSLAIE
jgi:hypothetical protein